MIRQSIFLALLAIGLPQPSVADPAATCVPPKTQPEPFCTVEVGTQVCVALKLPKGFAALPKAAFPPNVVKPLGGGGLCCGVVAKATADVAVYRAWAPHYDAKSQGKKPQGYAGTYQFGNWWGTEQPDLVDRSTYRMEEDICRAWNSLTVYSKCTLPKGTEVVIGPGQSACCDDNRIYLRESNALQVYVPNATNAVSAQPQFTNCETYVWPAKAP